LSGGTWLVDSATVRGSITVQSGARVVITRSTIGSLTASSPGAITLCGSTVSGGITISGASGFVMIGDPVDDGCPGNSISAGVTLGSNHAGVEVSHNSRIGGSLGLTQNAGAGPLPADVGPEVEANTVMGSVNCFGNSPGVTNNGEPNTVSGGRSGQCAAI
jgi:hypothetical protein